MFERQRMTKAFALREARYRTVVSFISDYVYSVAVEPGGTVRNEWITDAFTRITGFTGEELDAESGEFRLLHHADRPIFDEHMQILLSGQARTAEYRIISKSGAVYWIRDTAYPEWDALQGRVVRIVGAVQDITPQKHKEEEIRRLHADLEQRVNERTMEVVATNTILEQEIAKHRQTEKLLQENLEFVQAITNASPDIIYVYDFAAQRTVYINDSIFDMLGYTVQEIQEGTVPFFQAHLHPDDRALVLARYQQLQAQADAQVVEVEHRFRAAGGEWRWLYNRTLVLRRHPNGTIWHILGVLQDVTERKQSQDVQDQLQAQLQRERQRLDEIISTVPGVVWESWGQPDTLLQRINFVSPQIEAMLGYSTDEWLVTPNFWLHIIHPDDQEQALHKTMEVYTSGSGGTIQFRLIRKDGRPLWVEIHIAIVCDENQVPVGMRGVTLDISARKQAEIDLAQSLHYLSLLHAIIQATFEQQAPDTIAGSALHRLLALMPCERASIILFDDDRQQASVLAVATLSTTTVLPGTRFSVVGLAGVDVIRRDQTYIVDDLTQLVQISPPVDTMIAEGLRSSISVPLKARGELIGALTIYAKEPNAFTTSDAAFLRQAGDHLGVTIDNGRLFTQVNAGRQRLQVLARQLIEVQETERRTLAHELHDEIGQALTALIINLQAAQRNPLSAQLALPLAESIEIVQQTLQQIRNISLDLRPSLLDDLGLVATLRWYLDRQSQRMNIPMYFVGEPITPRLPPLLEITCFRLVQEAITNVARHASARTVDVTLRLQGEHVDLTIHDDGVGFDVAAALARAAQSGSLGLLGMQERAVLLGGQVTIDSAPGMGTTIVARFPRALRTRLERRSRKGSSS
jgi:PAS domain S-box-containing protein